MTTSSRPQPPTSRANSCACSQGEQSGCRGWRGCRGCRSWPRRSRSKLNVNLGASPTRTTNLFGPFFMINFCPWTRPPRRQTSKHNSPRGSRLDLAAHLEEKQSARLAGDVLLGACGQTLVGLSLGLAWLLKRSNRRPRCGQPMTTAKRRH